MSKAGYESLSNQLVGNDKLELQGKGENLEAIIKALPLEGVRRVLDVGCGSGFLTRELARLLGPESEVYGVDLSPDHIAYARRAARSGGLSNVHYFERDIFDPFGALEGAFDLVYEKYVLMTMIPRGLASDFLLQMKRCARAGGHVVCIEADINFGQDRFPPPPEELSALLPKIVEYYRRQGLIEWRSGIQIFHHMKAVGFSRVDVRLADGRILAGGLPRELAEHDSIDTEQLLGPVLDSTDESESTQKRAQQWVDYLNSPDNFIYSPIFVGIGNVEGARPSWNSDSHDPNFER